MPTFSRDDARLATVHIGKRDPALAGVIQAVGPFRLKRQTNRFQSLLRAIVAQQISTAAARSIWARIEAAAGTPSITSEAIHNLPDEALRGAGISPQKLKYVRDLTDHVHSGRLKLHSLHRQSDDDVIAALTDVKGVGVWTAQMFLMFSLGRPDVLPHGDLGIQTAIRNLYQLDQLPGREECFRIAEPWRPYATIACWYLWRSIELEAAARKQEKLSKRSR